MIGVLACATHSFAQGAAPDAPPTDVAPPTPHEPPAPPAPKATHPPEDDVLGFGGGFHYLRYTLELHVRERFALRATDPPLQGETTVGSLSVGSALLRVQLLDRPMLEIMAGPAMVTTPIFAVTVDDLGDQRVEGMAVDGIGVMAGAAIGLHVTPQVALSFEVRALFATRWELPGGGWVVPTTLAPDGGRMFTVGRGDATGDARTATILLRAFL